MQNKINHPFAQRKKSHRPTLLFAVVAMLTTGAAKIAQAADVVIETNRGVIEVVLDVDRAPLTVANFLAYVAADGTGCAVPSGDPRVYGADRGLSKRFNAVA